ncbi:hypothetical protein [Bacillus subtilis]|uniref:hypothetical protein n=1 Tax=Bacillus subtilis TaxID=1423 RepID=UPI0011A5F70D|nr:hypothetical protein [Bacillus subtilis]
MEKENVRWVVMGGDVGDEKDCEEGVEERVEDFGKVDMLVKKAGEEDGEERIVNICMGDIMRGLF